MNKCVPPQDNKFSALHGAVWSGGSFLYVPKDVKVDLPLQAYFRMEGANEGTFEHTLIIADSGSEVNYIEGYRADLLGQLDATRPSSRSLSRRAQRPATRPCRTGRRTCST